MARRNWFIWRRRIFLTVVAALISFGMSLILPWHHSNSQQSFVFATENTQTQKVTKGSKELQGDKSAIAQKNEAFRKVINRLQKQVKDALLTFSIPKQFQGKIIEEVQINPQEKVIALTFDDGPWIDWTLQVVDILKQNKIKGTFFWIGRNLQTYPEIAKKVVDEGHAIGNHTWHHWYQNMSAETAAKEIDDTSSLIYKITGVKTSLFRPPGGFLHNGVADYAKKKNYIIAMWSADSIDYSRPGVDRLVNNIMREAHPGGMVLMHDGGGDRSQTVKALPIIIDKLRDQGYKFVTVPQLLEMEAKKPIIVHR